MPVTRFAGGLAIVVGALELVGWAPDFVLFRRWFPAGGVMTPSAAASFVAIGISLWFSIDRFLPSARHPQHSTTYARAARFCAPLAGLIGLLSGAGISPSVRMAPDTALCFVLIAAGLEILYRARQTKAAAFTVATLGFCAATLSVAASVVRLAPVTGVDSWWGLTNMSAPTAVLFTMLSAAMASVALRKAPETLFSRFAMYVSAVVLCLIATIAAFGLYAKSEREGERSSLFRYQSALQSEDLRQTEDDLSRMAQTYFVTRDPAYKQRFQDILDVRNGRKPRLNDTSPAGGLSLLQLMRQAGITDVERRALTLAKADADQLISVEIAAMTLAESSGPAAEADRARARELLFGEDFQRTKTAFEAPVRDFIKLVDQRTLVGVTTAHAAATRFRNLAALCGLGLIVLLWRAYAALDEALGGSVGDAHRDRVRTTERLAVQADLLNTLVNSSSDVVIFSLDRNYCYTAFNEKHRQEMRTVWHAEIQVGTNLLECMSEPQLRALAKQSIDRALGGEAFTEVQSQPELRISYEFVWSPIRRNDGVVTGVTASIRDITDRVQAEAVPKVRARLTDFAASHSLGELLQQTLDEVGALTGSPVGFYHFVEADQRTLALQAWSTRTLREYCQAEGNGRHYDINDAGVWADCIRQRRPLIHNDYASLPHRQGLPPGHAPLVRELVVPIFRQDRVVAVLGVGNKATDYNEKDLGIVTLLVDGAWEVAERKQAEAALRASEERFKSFFEQSNVGQSITLPSGEVQVNQAFCDLLGRTRDELQHVDWPAISHPDDFEATQEVVETLLSGRQTSARFAKRYLHKNGSVVWTDVSTTLRRDANGQPLHFLTSVVDITERTQAEAALSELNVTLERRVEDRTAQLEASSRELESFSYSVSHNLRAPLRHIHGYVELLTRATEGQIAEKPQRYLRTISAASLEMGRLIDDLLALSRTNRVEILKYPVDLGLVVQEAIRLLDLETAGRKVIWDVAPLPMVLGEPSLLKQVFANLLDNAVKYTRRCDTARIDIGTIGEEPGRVVLFVRDNGVGFDMRYVDKLFGVFQRLHRLEEFEGTGIGLATVRRIVARHGGRVWAEGTVDHGATFYLSLPRGPVEGLATNEGADDALVADSTG